MIKAKLITTKMIILKRLLAFFLLALIPFSALSASLTASVNRTNIAINEAVILTINYDGDVDSDKLDLSPLVKDFEVLNTRPQSSSNISIINGKTTRVTSTIWRIALVGKREGKLIIPSLNIESDSTDAIIINVSPAGSTPEQEKPLNAKLRINKGEAYPGEQILITLELAANTTVGNLSGEPFKIDGGELELLDQQQTQRVDKGIAKQVITWKYAVFVDSPGEVTLPALTFTGLVGGRRSLFDSFGSRGEQVIARTKARSIKIKPQPEISDASWFNADNVSITSKWSTDIASAKVGEPITRTIAIVAQGQKANAIPPLEELQDNTGFRAYSDQPQLDNRNSARGITGTRIETVAIVPNKEGELTLPEQRLSWWNNTANEWREAVLPAQTLTVAAGIANTVAPNITPIDNRVVVNHSAANPDAILPWQIATIILALMTLIQSYFLFSKTKTQANQQHNRSHPNVANAWKEVHASLKQNDAASIRTSLLNWSKALQPTHRYHSLQKLADSLDHEHKQYLLQLDDHLYKGRDLNLNTLKAAINQLKLSFAKSDKTGKEGNSALQPLYPS